MIATIRAWLQKKVLSTAQKRRIHSLEKAIGLRINRPDLYLKALRHRSLIAEKNLPASESYEQLEFIGDAVLDLVVSDMIYKRYPAATEGFMTKLRSQLVKGEMLAHIARDLELHDYIELGERVRNQGIERIDSVLADCFEAVAGAVYLDQGYDRVQDLISRLYERLVEMDTLVSSQDNYKSMLLETVQAKKLPAPVYRIVNETGPGHDKRFYVEVAVGEKVMGSGRGKNKKKAEQFAAKQALQNLKETR